MVIVFAVGFAFLGVGSGGLDLASLVQDVFGAGGSGTSISKAQSRTRKHPNDPAAWRALADAYGSHGRTADQITALEHYVELEPKDATQLQNLAQLQVTQATNEQQANAAARQDQASVANASFFAPRIGGTDPIMSALQLQVSTAERNTFTAYRDAVKHALATLRKLTAIQPGASSYDDLATAAAQYGENGIAIKAYKQELRYTSDPGTEAQIRARIKALRAANPTLGG
jgi:predicted Zn-dependent protease